MLHDGFTGSEPTGDTGGATFCDGEKSIKDTLSREQGDIWHEFLLEWSGLTHWPVLHESNVFSIDGPDWFFDGETSFMDLREQTILLWREENPMGDIWCFLDCTEDGSTIQISPFFCGRDEFPFLFPV